MRGIAAAVRAPWLIALACFGGCADAEPTAPVGPRPSAEVGDGVVSTVNGEPITVEEVARVVRITGVSPRQALRHLQRFHLLAHEAERRGHDEHPIVRRSAQKAAVQALLVEEVEAQVPAAEGVQARFQRLARLVDRLESRYGVERRPHVMEGLGVGLGTEAP